jgi:6,7-dimethyl-8-ribityllumazine synthase
VWLIPAHRRLKSVPQYAVGKHRHGLYTRWASPETKLSSEKSQPRRQTLNASSFRFAIVASRWNDAIVSRLIDGALKVLQQASAADDAVELFRVPGAFEIPLCAQKAAESKRFDAVICLGVVIRGDTPHFEYIAASAARGISEASLRTGVPLLFGVITADNVEQADERARDDENNKGYEAAMAAIEVANLYREAFIKS